MNKNLLFNMFLMLKVSQFNDKLNFHGHKKSLMFRDSYQDEMSHLQQFTVCQIIGFT